MATRKRKALKHKSSKAKAKMRLRPARAKLKARPKAVRRNAKSAYRRAPKRVAKRIVRKVARRPVRALRVKAQKPCKPKSVKRRVKGVEMLENGHVRNLLVELAGEKALKVVGEMTEPLSDEDISKCAGIKISEIRAVLNKLHAAGIAAYDRTRNDEGWYTYTWHLSEERTHEMLGERKAQEQQSAQERRVLESTVDFYSCPSCFKKTSSRLNFEQAVEAGFRCPDCAEMLRYAEKKR